jgi:DNA-binding MarR family transcriptional regulator
MTAVEPAQSEAAGQTGAISTAKSAVETGFLITRLHALLRRTMDERLRDLGLSTAHYVLLRELGSAPALSAAELARRAYVRPQAVAPLLSALEQQGLIERSPHRRLRRVIEVRLTAKGRDALAQCGQRCETVEQQLLAGLNHRDRLRLQQDLQTCLDNMDPPWYEDGPATS